MIEEILNQIAEELDWNIDINKDFITFQRYSSANQDFSFEVANSGDLEEIFDDVESYCKHFDVSEQAYLWLDNTGHGKNGAPYEMIDVYKDMEECYNEIEKLKDRLFKAYTEN